MTIILASLIKNCANGKPLCALVLAGWCCIATCIYAGGLLLVVFNTLSLFNAIVRESVCSSELVFAVAVQ